MITILCPTLNEYRHIDKIIDFVTQSAPKEKELIIIDGGSTDGTVELIISRMNEYPNIKLLHNPKKYVPFALNQGIKNSTGDPIIRLDAHTEYSPDYINEILNTFASTNADIVGGPMSKLGKSDFQKAVAYCTSSSFGIGDSKIHKNDYSGPSDHVYLGAWRRELFSQIGYFDESLLRNQDDEFHYRAKSMGKVVYLSSRIKSFYFPRENFSSLFKQYFQYGLFKPLVVKKIKSELKLRHLIPAFFALYLLTFPLWFIFKFLMLPLILYLILDLLFSLKSFLNMYSIALSIFIFPAIHFGYGLGFILGAFGLFTGSFELIVKRFILKSPSNH